MQCYYYFNLNIILGFGQINQSDWPMSQSFTINHRVAKYNEFSTKFSLDLILHYIPLLTYKQPNYLRLSSQYIVTRNLQFQQCKDNNSPSSDCKRMKFSLFDSSHQDASNEVDIRSDFSRMSEYIRLNSTDSDNQIIGFTDHSSFVFKSGSYIHINTSIKSSDRNWFLPHF
ncbi:hypothetical protein RCL_jg2443.t1 [Rhizophagus clarus]|uniref:Uncharacterized protein n=1 Tax=Rhizophagus clarus TaxID=94130 RepID=A0A8H3LQP0_9GLOM|nr:hypothetical protein RCL_jg2443.t1 [Rhizophagus clarus]